MIILPIILGLGNNPIRTCKVQDGDCRTVTTDEYDFSVC